MDKAVMKEMVTDFVAKLQVKLTEYYTKKFPTLTEGKLEVKFGRRYAKLPRS